MAQPTPMKEKRNTTSLGLGVGLEIYYKKTKQLNKKSRKRKKGDIKFKKTKVP